MRWSTDLFGPVECRRLGQAGFQHNNDDELIKIFPIRAMMTQLNMYCVLFTPNRLILKRRCVNTNVIQQTSTVEWICDDSPTFCIFSLVLQKFVFSRKQISSVQPRVKKTKQNIQSAVTGGFSIALMFEPQHAVLLTCEQMWRSLNYIVDLMT